MFTDLVLPVENEAAFIRMAERLGTECLCFCYCFQPKMDITPLRQKLLRLQEKTSVRLSLCLIVKPTDTMKARNLADLIIVKATLENRPTLEKKEADCIYELENSPKPDKMHYAVSGLNQVLCAVAQESKMIILFSFAMVLNSERTWRATLLGRMRYNTRLCRKYHVGAAFASLARDPQDMRPWRQFVDLATTLGMHPSDAQKSVAIISSRIKENQLRKQGKFYGEGIDVDEHSPAPK